MHTTKPSLQQNTQYYSYHKRHRPPHPLFLLLFLISTSCPVHNDIKMNCKNNLLYLHFHILLLPQVCTNYNLVLIMYLYFLPTSNNNREQYLFIFRYMLKIHVILQADHYGSFHQIYIFNSSICKKMSTASLSTCRMARRYHKYIYMWILCYTHIPK